MICGRPGRRRLFAAWVLVLAAVQVVVADLERVERVDPVHVVVAPNVPDAYNLYSSSSKDDDALPLVHFSRRIFWATMATGFTVGMLFGFVFVACWRRQMSIDKLDSDFGEVSIKGARSSFQMATDYQPRKPCECMPCCQWFRL